MMMNRLRMSADLSDAQEWLYDQIVTELEWRCVEDLRLRPMAACTCVLCLPTFPVEHSRHERDDERDDPPDSRPEGTGITRKRTQRPAHQQPE